jgi:hypothetical protein
MRSIASPGSGDIDHRAGIQRSGGDARRDANGTAGGSVGCATSQGHGLHQRAAKSKFGDGLTLEYEAPLTSVVVVGPGIGCPLSPMPPGPGYGRLDQRYSPYTEGPFAEDALQLTRTHANHWVGACAAADCQGNGGEVTNIAAGHHGDGYRASGSGSGHNYLDLIESGILRPPI